MGSAEVGAAGNLVRQEWKNTHWEAGQAAMAFPAGGSSMTLPSASGNAGHIPSVAASISNPVCDRGPSAAGKRTAAQTISSFRFQVEACRGRQCQLEIASGTNGPRKPTTMGQRTTLCWMVSWLTAHEVPAANLADQIRYELPGWVAL